MPAEEQFSRLLKLTHAQTILYEIDMLRLSKDRLISSSFSSDGDKWIYIEAFLLHYRNVLEFFSGTFRQSTDLSIAKPAEIWTEQLPDQLALANLTKPEFHRKRVLISRYLHHCTTYRVTAMDWNIAAMFDELRPVLEAFELLLPNYELNAPWRKAPGSQTSGGTICSTFSTR